MGISVICCEMRLFRCEYGKKQGVTDKRIDYTFAICTLFKKAPILRAPR